MRLKLVLNGSYGAFATKYFILFNEHVAGTITSEGRALTQTMDKSNQDYWYNKWHLDTELHSKMGIIDVTKIKENYIPVIWNVITMILKSLLDKPNLRLNLFVVISSATCEIRVNKPKPNI